MGLRVVLDTNVLISHLLSMGDDNIPDRIVDAAIRGEFSLVICEELITELVSRVARKSYLARRIDRADLASVVSILSGIGEEIDISDVIYPEVVRDPADDFLIALATLGRADVLVSGDHDLLELDLPLPFRIMSLSDFLAEIEGE